MANVIERSAELSRILDNKMDLADLAFIGGIISVGMALGLLLLGYLTKGKDKKIIKKPNILDDQFKWMTGAVSFIRSVDPKRADNLMARIELQLVAPCSDTPKRVTEMVLEELEEMKKEQNK